MSFEFVYSLYKLVFVDLQQIIVVHVYVPLGYHVELGLKLALVVAPSEALGTDFAAMGQLILLLLFVVIDVIVRTGCLGLDEGQPLVLLQSDRGNEVNGYMPDVAFVPLLVVYETNVAV